MHAHRSTTWRGSHALLPDREDQPLKTQPLKTLKTLTQKTVLVSCCVAWVAVASLYAQTSALAPTSDTTIVVSGPAPLRYRLINIPAGVTVRFVAAYVPGAPVPAVVICEGDAIVHGSLYLAGDLMNGIGWPAGMVDTGEGTAGQQCTSSSPLSSYYRPPTGGRHAGDYGTAVPFSLEGGSPGGLVSRYVDTGPPVVVPCGYFSNWTFGGAGGGTLALVAGGRIEVGGAVTADGYHLGISGGGSGGSILLRGHQGVTVLPGGSVTARGGWRAGEHPPTRGAPGYVRLDAWGAPPDVQGTVVPAPTALELPHLRVVTPLQLGTTSLLQVFAPRGTSTWLFASPQPGPGTPTPFGVLGLDPLAAGLIGIAPISTLTPNSPEHDPRAGLLWPIPNAPALIGLLLWIQGLTSATNLPARLTNTVAAVIG